MIIGMKASEDLFIFGEKQKHRDKLLNEQVKINYYIIYNILFSENKEGINSH